MPFWSISSFWDSAVEVSVKLTFELTSGYFEYAYAMLLLQPELMALQKKYIKVQNKTKINAAYDNVKYFFSCRKIFFLFKVSRMDMCLWCVGTYRGVCWSKFVALFSLLSSPGEIWRARHPGQHILLVQVTGSWCNVLSTLEVPTFTISREGACWNGLLLANWIWIYHKLTSSKHDLCT